MTIYHWQQSIWQQLQQSSERLPHALLLYGQPGIGKLDFAKSLSQSLLCKSPQTDGKACGHCDSCHWFDDGSHPDFRDIHPEDEGDDTGTKKTKKKKKKIITVQQVRGLSDFMNLTSHNDVGLRIILIQPAETMNVESANALLKMLEEPANNAMFILVSHQLPRLLPTITSRCHKIAMPVPNVTEASAWLKSEGVANAEAQLAYFANSPIQVKAQSDQFDGLKVCWQLLAKGDQAEPARIANKLVTGSVEQGIIILQKWLYDIVSIHSTGETRYHLTQRKALEKLASQVNLTALFEFQKKIESIRKLASHPLNHELQLETLLLEYTQLFK